MKPVVFAECLLCSAPLYPPPPGEAVCPDCAQDVATDAAAITTTTEAR